MKHKNSILVLLGVLCLILVGAVVYTAFIRQPDAVETDSEASEGSGGRYITYKGKEYRRDQNVQALLLMGVDRESTAQVGEQTGDAGQADSLNLLILNKKEQTAKILQISRDSAVDIDVYDENGSKVMTAEGQLCLQYAFGDGGGRSCRLTVEKTEELLGGIDIDSYLALTLDGIKVAVDAAGGIPITVPEDEEAVDGGSTGSGGISGCSASSPPAEAGKATSVDPRHTSSPPEAKVMETGAVSCSGARPEREKLVTYSRPVSSARAAPASAAGRPLPTT